MAGDYSIGSEHWPGLSKLAEEAGEVIQVVGKLLGTGGEIQHWDGSNLRTRLQEELADLTAAIAFVIDKNGFDEEVFERRVEEKFAVFNKWHDENIPKS